MVLPQFFGNVPFSPHLRARFGRFNDCHGRDWAGKKKEGTRMEASAGRSRMRLLVVDFLATLFVTFCIGTATALVLGACVVLMAGDAHGATKAQPRAVAPADAAPATTADLVLAHYFAAKYAGLVAVDRFTGASFTATGTAAQSEPNVEGARGCPG